MNRYAYAAPSPIRLPDWQRKTLRFYRTQTARALIETAKLEQGMVGVEPSWASLTERRQAAEVMVAEEAARLSAAELRWIGPGLTATAREHALADLGHVCIDHGFPVPPGDEEDAPQNRDGFALFAEAYAETGDGGKLVAASWSRWTPGDRDWESRWLSWDQHGRDTAQTELLRTATRDGGTWDGGWWLTFYSLSARPDGRPRGNIGPLLPLAELVIPDGWELPAKGRLEGDATPWHYARPVLAALRLLRELPRERTVGELSQRVEHIEESAARQRADRRAGITGPRRVSVIHEDAPLPGPVQRRPDREVVPRGPLEVRVPVQKYTRCPNRAEHGPGCEHRDVKGYTRGPDGAPLYNRSQRVRAAGARRRPKGETEG
ncbi:hypothetical protein F7Q99_36065 [Streptomyces kaniharaensis]|uniref:Uncharacterized protein n=1 Tax=Streptomyces kaniharaensis TaxID=212423 RepID=A0A6N7L4C8_9ACTN|nr:hypothetical protein [Streptomyces kaniharaensis]MQS17458.1 hypothetical protein [Streptomyces kaniharaensis]